MRVKKPELTLAVAELVIEQLQGFHDSLANGTISGASWDADEVQEVINLIKETPVEDVL